MDAHRHCGRPPAVPGISGPHHSPHDHHPLLPGIGYWVKGEPTVWCNRNDGRNITIISWSNGKPELQLQLSIIH